MTEAKNLKMTTLRVEAGKGAVFGLVGSKDSGKTTIISNLLTDAQKYDCGISAYFYHDDYKTMFDGQFNLIYNLNQLEQIKDNIIFIDEFAELFNLNDRKQTDIIKSVLSQVAHNNNIVILCGLPDYFKKYICSQVDGWLLCGLNYDEIINGSQLADYIKNLSGQFKGGTRLNIAVGVVMYEGHFYNIPYKKEWDKKAKNKNLLTLRSDYKEVSPDSDAKRLNRILNI